MTPAEVTVIERFVNRSDVYCQRLDNRYHGDTNLFNQLYKSDSNDTITVDWQTTIIGNWGQEVVYFFLSNNMDAEMRNVHEADLLENYHGELSKRGGSIHKEELDADFNLV